MGYLIIVLVVIALFVAFARYGGGRRRTTTTASLASRCPACGAPISAGDAITKVRATTETGRSVDRFICEDCAQKADAAG